MEKDTERMFEKSISMRNKTPAYPIAIYLFVLFITSPIIFRQSELLRIS
ncbi:MAG: hypothetical protein U5O15_05560 [Candidatus Krumholzibacteriota bacterium]|nr:hypothetical protein [Candidatus Krumholzibacteriota bacterium]